MQYFLFYNQELLLTENNSIPYDMGEVVDCKYTFVSHDKKYIAANINSVPTNFKTVKLRDSYDVLSREDYLNAGKAYELVFWNENNKYCGKCGGLLRQVSDINKKCDFCGTEIWPKISPAIIVLIYDEDRILLVKSKTFKGTYFGLVAGFVEFGESLEEAVVREIKEETNLEVDNIKYFDSQPWPYPNGLMIGFTAKYKSGHLNIQESELQEGNWYSINNLPEIPKPLSMANMLINHYLNKYKE